MLDISTQMRPESSLVRSLITSSGENQEPRTGVTSDTSNQHHPESEPETVIRCDHPAMNESESRPTSTSKNEEPGNISNIISDNASDDFADGSTSSQVVFDTVPNGQSETLVNGSCDKLNEEDTVSVNTPTSIDISVPSHEEPTAILTTPSDDSSGGFFESVSDTTTESSLASTSNHHCKQSMNQNAGAEPVIVPASCPVNGSSTFGESITGDEKSVTVSKTAFDDGTFDGPDNGFGASLRSFDSFSEGERKNITFIDTSLPPRGSQSTAAYASPLQDDCRLRTSCDSIHDEGHWHADLDGFINEKDRAGGPYLCARPVKMTRPKGTDTLWGIFENLSLVKLILSTLDHYNIKAISMVTRNCEYKFERQLERMPTLLITATRDKFSDSWVKACREIWKHLSENEFGQVNIEIADPAVHSGRPFYAWTVQPQEPLYSVYSDIIAKIHDQVDFSEILSISGLRVGESPDEENSDPFIFVTVSHRSNQDWRCVRDQIVSILDEYNLPMVGVHILKSKMWGGTWGL